jgi:hypothetical protein
MDYRLTPAVGWESEERTGNFQFIFSIAKRIEILFISPLSSNAFSYTGLISQMKYVNPKERHLLTGILYWLREEKD